MLHLPRQAPAREPESAKYERDHNQNCGDATDPPLQPRDRWREHEREQDRQRERHEHGLRPVQDSNDQHDTGESDPRLH
jgi:hypothetical protein